MESRVKNFAQEVELAMAHMNPALKDLEVDCEAVVYQFINGRTTLGEERMCRGIRRCYTAHEKGVGEVNRAKEKVIHDI